MNFFENINQKFMIFLISKAANMTDNKSIITNF